MSLFSKSKRKQGESATKQALLAFQEELLRTQEMVENDRSSDLSLRFEALWQLLKERLELTDEDLEKHLEALQQTEPEETEKVKQEPQPCPKCGRPLLLKTNSCLYCGGKDEAVAEALKRFSEDS